MKIDNKIPRKKISGVKNLLIAIIVSDFNRTITEKLVKGAKLALKENRVSVKNIRIFKAPGAFEIPVIASSLIHSSKERFDGIITLGCIIKGETAHFEYISSSVSSTLNFLSAQERVPIGFGILTCYTKQQAMDRSRINPITPEGNKGYEAAMAVLETLNAIGRF
jgi:6,7-dimethyl-8-ribityllumazine synthase